ncbi:hypothetical protein CANINC_001482 [Pichia inconspicua]|uniref:G-patch domain-containing protein n=1 Tax=Pichia inconspicua TaxID=52247 RepID=A0A4T0X3L3_9ASCO|nr:hypothetical protein CANINC_001482 [[Candida] inconspicua]
MVSRLIKLCDNIRGHKMGKKNGGKKGGRGGRGVGRNRGAVKGDKREARSKRNGYHGDAENRQLQDDIESFARRQGLFNDLNPLRNTRTSQSKVLKKMKATKLNQINEMVDLNRGDFNNVEEMSLNAMMYERPRRKNRKENSMFNEVSYTSMHRGDIFNKSYRKLTIEFVKAKDTYDPSKELIEKLANKRHQITEAEPSIANIVDLTEKLIKENEIKQIMKSDIEAFNPSDSDTSSSDFIEEDDNRDGNGTSSKLKIESECCSSLTEVGVLEKREIKKSSHCTEPNLTPRLSFRKVETKQKRTELTIYDDNNEVDFNISFDDDEDDDDSDSLGEVDSFDESEQDDVIEDNLEVDSDEISDNVEDDVSGDDEFVLGKFSGKMKKTKLGENYIELPALNKNKAIKNLPKSRVVEKMIYSVNDETADLSIDDVVRHVNTKMHGDAGDEKKLESEESSDPEFGFLEEDYVSFDITQIKVENIRLGSSEKDKQFYVQASILFGFDDFIWISRTEFEDLLTENGLPEHRFNAFIKKATGHLVPPDTADEIDDFDEDQMFISDSSDDEDDDDEIFTSSDLKMSSKKSRIHKERTSTDGYQSDGSLMNDSELDEELMEGMDDLLNMHKLSKNNNFDPLEVNTRTTRIRGKGKRLKLEHNVDVNPEFQQYLHDKYIAQKNRRKDNKEEREIARKNNSYMLVRYPYLMEMQDIIDEFKDFYKDPVRESLRFPPMDPHVHIVLKSVSEAFGFPSKKIGKGSKQYVEVRKAHKNKSRHPDWNRIDRLAKKRSICFRMDVSLSREEKRELKRIKGGDAEVEKLRNKGRGNFSYKEGEIVGATAKEIDSESIGRKLLEKMGWRTGESLGPDSNKGIIEPIKVVVKTSKRGIV